MRTEIHSINFALAKSPFLLLFHAFSIDFPCSSQRDNKTRLVLFIKVSHSLSQQALCSPARDVNLKGKCCHLKQKQNQKKQLRKPSFEHIPARKTRPRNTSRNQADAFPAAMLTLLLGTRGDHQPWEAPLCLAWMVLALGLLGCGGFTGWEMLQAGSKHLAVTPAPQHLPPFSSSFSPFPPPLLLLFLLLHTRSGWKPSPSSSGGKSQIHTMPSRWILSVFASRQWDKMMAG